MERSWSDEGGLQAASLVFEHLSVWLKCVTDDMVVYYLVSVGENGTHALCWGGQRDRALLNRIALFELVKDGSDHTTHRIQKGLRFRRWRDLKKIYTPYLFLFELGVWVSEDATVCFVEWWTSSSVNNMLMFSWEGKQLANHFLWPGRIEKTPLDVDQETPVVLLIINGEDYTRIFCHFFFTVSYRDPSCFLTVSLCRLRSFLPSWDWASA